MSGAERFAAILALVVGALILGLWAFLLAARKVPPRRRGGSSRGRITPIGERSGPFRHRSSTWATRAAIGPFAVPLPARIL